MKDVLKDVYTNEELDRFKVVAENMYLPYDPERNILMQQDNFMDKELLSADSINPADRPICHIGPGTGFSGRAL